nr:restriction endonuclease subunit S [Acinetobacter sp. YH12069]
MASPKLRFKEFKADWTNTSLGLLSDKIGDGIHATPDYDNQGEIPFINGNNLIDGVVTINENTKRINVSEFQKYKQNLSNQTIFLSINGTIGNLAFYQNEKLLLGKSVCFINLKQTVDKFFVYQILQSPLLKKTFNSELTGTTIKNLSLATVRSSDFFCPHKEEQTQIAFFLSAVDEKINQLTQKHELLSQYKQGMMQKLFSQQIRFKADDGSEFREWVSLKIFDIAKDKSLNNGVFNDQNKVGKGYKLINVLDMYISRDIDEKRLNLLDLDKKEFEKNKVQYGDIFFTRSSLVKEGIAFSNVYLGNSDDITYDGHLIKLSPDLDRVSSKFLNYCLKMSYVRKQLIQGGKTATMTTIGQQEVGNTVVVIPCLEEQTKIANFLTAIDQKIEIVAQQIEQAKQWKKGLLQQMFV